MAKVTVTYRWTQDPPDEYEGVSPEVVLVDGMLRISGEGKRWLVPYLYIRVVEIDLEDGAKKPARKAPKESERLPPAEGHPGFRERPL